MLEKYTADEKNRRAREFSDAVYRELRALNGLAIALFNIGHLNRGLFVTDFFVHQSLERSTHTRQVMETGEWPTMSGKAVTPRDIRQIAEQYHRRAERVRDDYPEDGQDNWRLVRVARALAGEEVTGQTHPPRVEVLD